MGTVVLLVLLVAGLLALLLLYNRLVARYNAVDNAFSTVDVQLKQRCDLIPRVVEATRGYMQYESELLERLTTLRAEATTPGLQPTTRFQLDGEMGGLLSRVFAVSEQYPELRASQSILLLQRTLNEVEAQIAAARRTYNAAVTEYNTTMQQFPANIVAGTLGFARRNLFEAAAGEREAVRISALDTK
jgi:LemA protein